MKKSVSIFAVMLMTLGMFSCEAETNLDETDAVYELDVQAGDGDYTETECRRC